MASTVTLESVLALASQNRRICPQPHAWTRLYELLPEKRQDPYGPIPALPLVLDAWRESTDEQKACRLREHLEWAAQHGGLARVFRFLEALPESDWHHVGA